MLPMLNFTPSHLSLGEAVTEAESKAIATACGFRTSPSKMAVNSIKAYLRAVEVYHTEDRKVHLVLN